MQTETLAKTILTRAKGRKRLMVALAGAPGSGKSTLSEALCTALNAHQPGLAEVVPMDGYHLDNAVITPLGLLARKGAPETFDAEGLEHDLARIRAADQPVVVPVFDRNLDLARAGARIVGPEVPVVIVEGNYLLVTRDPWVRLAPLFDLTVFLSVPEPVLLARLIARWRHHGHDAASAEARARGNDLINAQTVIAHSAPAEIVVETV